HYIQHGDAEEVAATLTSLTGGGKAPARGGANANAAAANVELFEGQIKVTSHKASNALVITSSPHDYVSLKTVIDRLDAPRKQVFVEAVIMELSMNRSRQLGLSFHTGLPDVPSDGSIGIVGSNAARSVGGIQGLALDQTALAGMAVGVQGPLIPEAQELYGLSIPSFGMVLSALANNG
ncbi:MAG: type II secretion system protein GspD, partial [Myxococcales bacterium]|nr:type II secretion system protein GspD [Myxococcales bacterium]